MLNNDDNIFCQFANLFHIGIETETLSEYETLDIMKKVIV